MGNSNEEDPLTEDSQDVPGNGVSATRGPSGSDESLPDLSLVVPCYNEEAIVGHTLTQLSDAFSRANRLLQLIAVDNGSADRTGEIIAELAAERPEIMPVRVDVNVGYGNGVLEGFPRASAQWVGIIPADGQVDAEDVVRLFEAVRGTDGNVLGKVRRRFRMDGLVRKVVSVSYNLFFRVLWPGLRTLDVNGSPKIFPRRLLPELDLQSKAWFLDPELMVKAHYMGLRIVELNVFARMRGSGLSHIRAATCWEFLSKLLAFRFSPRLSRWRRRLSPE
jgi:glycosyltransferase involved in cell wall biosynthesis